MSELADKLRGIAATASNDGCPHEAVTLEEAAREIERLRAERDNRQQEANDSAHVIVEHGVVPGSDDSCRCEECRRVAVAMNGAGYLDRIRDRWWQTAEAAGVE